MIIKGVMDPSLGFPPEENSESAPGSNNEVQQQDDNATKMIMQLKLFDHKKRRSSEIH